MPNQRPKTVKTFGQLQAGITPLVPGQPERIPWVFYDTQTYVDNTTTILTFFQAVQANRANGNIEAAGQITAPQYFDVYHLGVHFSFLSGAATVSNLMALLNTGIVLLNIAQKQYFMAPLFLCPPGGGAFGNTAIATDQLGTNGNPDLRNRYCFYGDITIPHNQNFSVVLEWPAAVDIAANVNIKVALDGYLYRRVL